MFNEQTCTRFTWLFVWLSPCPKYLWKPYSAIFLKSLKSKDIKTDIPNCQKHKYTNTNTNTQLTELKTGIEVNEWAFSFSFCELVWPQYSIWLIIYWGYCRDDNRNWLLWLLFWICCQTAQNSISVSECKQAFSVLSPHPCVSGNT